MKMSLTFISWCLVCQKRSFGFKVAQLAQLPSSCIRRAAVMAARLEVVVSYRMGNKSDRVQLLEKTPSGHQQEELQENNLESPNCFNSGRTANYVDIMNDYKKFFMNLRFARLDEDTDKRFQFLENGRRIAKALVTRYFSMICLRILLPFI